MMNDEYDLPWLKLSERGRRRSGQSDPGTNLAP